MNTNHTLFNINISIRGGYPTLTSNPKKHRKNPPDLFFFEVISSPGHPAAAHGCRWSCSRSRPWLSCLAPSATAGSRRSHRCVHVLLLCELFESCRSKLLADALPKPPARLRRRRARNPAPIPSAWGGLCAGGVALGSLCRVWGVGGALGSGRIGASGAGQPTAAPGGQGGGTVGASRPAISGGRGGALGAGPAPKRDSALEDLSAQPENASS